VLIIPFAIALIGPVIMLFGDVRHSRWFGGGVVALAGLGALIFAFSGSFSARYPRPGDLFHYSDARTGKSYWATSSTKRELPAGQVSTVSPTGFGSIKWQAVPAPAAQTAAPKIEIAETGGRVSVSMASTAAPRLMNFMVTPSQALSNVRVNGRPVKLAKGEPTRIGWRAETAGARLLLEFDSGQAGSLTVDYLYAVPGMPAGAPPPRGPDTDWTLLNGTRVLGGSATLAFGSP
jgi:hypothetical protein